MTPGQTPLQCCSSHTSTKPHESIDLSNTTVGTPDTSYSVFALVLCLGSMNLLKGVALQYLSGSGVCGVLIAPSY